MAMAFIIRRLGIDMIKNSPVGWCIKKAHIYPMCAIIEMQKKEPTGLPAGSFCRYVSMLI